MWSIYGPKNRDNQRGQILPVVLATMALGALVIGPFLNQASSAMIGSRNYGVVTNETYSADAGAEHGIWRLAYNGLAATLPSVGNTVTYPLPNQVNSIAPSITITKTQAGGAAVGTITDAVVGSFQFDSANGVTPRIIHVSGTVYALVYEGPGSDGYLKTANVSSDGTTVSLIDTWASFALTCNDPQIIAISGNVYAIVYSGPGTDGYLITVTIAANGAITKSAISTLDFETSVCNTPQIVHVSGTVYAAVYSGSGSDGYLKTVNIAVNGTTISLIDTWASFALTCNEPQIIATSGNVYAIVYSGPSTDGYLIAITIAANGAITKSAISTLDFDSTVCNTPQVVYVSGTVYAVVYRGSGSDGYLKTVNISSDGTTVSLIDTWASFAPTCNEPQLINTSGNVYTLAYRGAGSDGTISTVTIAATGVITKTMIDTILFDTTGFEPCLLNIASDMYAVAYRGASTAGYLKTIGITQTGGTPVFSVQSTAGGATITASVQISGTTATVMSWVVQRQ